MEMELDERIIERLDAIATGQTAIATLIQHQNQLLNQLLAAEKQKDDPSYVEEIVEVIYPGDTHGGAWYWKKGDPNVNDGFVNIPERAWFKGVVKSIEYRETQRKVKGKETTVYKLWLALNAVGEQHKVLLFPTGYNPTGNHNVAGTTNFAKSLIAALSSLSADDLKKPISVQSRASKGGGIFAAILNHQGKQVKSELEFSDSGQGTDLKTMLETLQGKLDLDTEDSPQHWTEPLNAFEWFKAIATQLSSDSQVRQRMLQEAFNLNSIPMQEAIPVACGRLTQEQKVAIAASIPVCAFPDIDGWRERQAEINVSSIKSSADDCTNNMIQVTRDSHAALIIREPVA